MYLCAYGCLFIVLYVYEDHLLTLPAPFPWPSLPDAVSGSRLSEPHPCPVVKWLHPSPVVNVPVTYSRDPSCKMRCCSRWVHSFPGWRVQIQPGPASQSQYHRSNLRGNIPLPPQHPGSCRHHAKTPKVTSPITGLKPLITGLAFRRISPSTFIIT